MIHRTWQFALGAAFGVGFLGTGFALTGAQQEKGQDERQAPRYQPLVVVQLAVSDLDRAVKFYTETLGMELELEIEELRWAKIKTAVSGLTLGLGESKDTQGSGTVSVNLAVPDADRARAMLEGRGVKFQGETTDIPGVVRLADFQDPDGNRFRIAGPSGPK